MDSVVQLALISKAKKVFENESTFLSFPVMPLAYKKEALEFFSQKDAADLIQSKNNLHAFSTLVNLIPGDEAWLPTEPRFLWGEYEYILNQGICATSTRTPEEEAALQKAKAYLKVPGDGGIMQDSSEVRVYKQYRDAHFMAEQEFMEARSTGEAAEDEAEKKKWRAVDEPAFRAKLKDLENKWILEGYKNEVEIAQNTVIILGAKSPILTWAEWREQFNPDFNSETGLSDISRVFPSSFTPSNALDDGSWKPFSLSKAEVKSLVNEAPPDLRQQFSANGKESSIKSMTFEFSSAAIVRPWFDPEVFRSRFWRLPDPAHIISDGGKPPSGACPAYVTAIVFARNVTIKQQQTPQGTTTPVAAAGLRFNYAVKDQTRIRQINPVVMKAVRLQGRQLRAMGVRPVRPQFTTLGSPPPPTIRLRRATVASVQPAAVRVRPATGYRAAPVTIKASTFTRMPAQPIRPPANRPAPQPARPNEAADHSIYIFAFICKPLPKSPDPDPKLDWPF